MKSVLIVEDELMIAMFNQQVVEDAGYIVQETITSGEEAVEVTRNNCPDLILMDIMLEGEIDGVEAMEEIREFSDVPVIYVTGNSNSAVKERAEKTSYTDFIVKPASPDVLSVAVKSTLNE